MVESMRRLTRLPARAVVAVASLLYRTFRMYMADQCGTYAAAIAYYALFSLIPLTLVVVSVFGLIVDRERVVTFIFEQIPLQQTSTVERDVQSAVARATNVSPGGLALGLAVLAWSASGMFGAVRRGLNATTHMRGQSYIHGKLVDLALIPALGVLIVLSIGLTAAVQVAFQRAGALGWIDIENSLTVQFAALALPALASLVMFFLLYRFVPSSRPAWPDAFGGALLATVLFEVAKNVAAYLVANAPYIRDSALYAGLGTALAFLFWIFIAASILLAGAEFGRALSSGREARKPGDAVPAGGAAAEPVGGEQAPRLDRVVR